MDPFLLASKALKTWWAYKEESETEIGCMDQLKCWEEKEETQSSQEKKGGGE